MCHLFGFPFPQTTDDERLALLDRFCAEGLDVRKISDTQKLPFVWRWLVDAEINCQSLRHTIEKMRIQHDEELQVSETGTGGQSEPVYSSSPLTCSTSNVNGFLWEAPPPPPLSN